MTQRARQRALTILLLAAACTSPESTRARGGGAGADVGNWGVPVEFHAGADPDYEVPCEVVGVECHGPRSVFGPRPAAE